MDILIAQIISGLAMGATYSLIVTGFNLLFLVRGVLPFAVAHIAVLSMYAAWITLGLTNDNLVLAIPVAILAGVLLNVLTEPTFRPLALRRAFLETMVVGLGIGIIATEVMSHFLHQGRTIAFPEVLVGGGGMVRLGMIVFSLGDVYTLLGAIGAVIGLFYFLNHHKEGRAFRAIAQDLHVARLLGIPLNRTGIYSFAICGLLAGLSGVLMAMTLGSAGSGLGDTLAIKAVVLMMFAGMGNLKGGLICAFIMGLAEALAMAYLPGRWTEAVVFSVIMIAIIVRPKGVFGSQA